MAHSFDSPKEMYDLHTVDINHTRRLLYLSRESIDVLFWIFFPAIKQGEGKFLIPFAQVKLVLYVHSDEGRNMLPAYQVPQTPKLDGDQHLACGD